MTDLTTKDLSERYPQLRMTINIELDERDALVKLAHQQHRDFRQQAAMLIREKLIELGLLSDSRTKSGPSETK